MRKQKRKKDSASKEAKRHGFMPFRLLFKGCEVQPIYLTDGSIGGFSQFETVSETRIVNMIKAFYAPWPR